METEPSTKQQHKQDKQYIDSFFSRHFLETYFHRKNN
jgi:hypothetical protein